MQHEPRHPGQPADRSDVRRLLRRPGAGGYHNGALYSDPRIADVHRDGPAPDARRRVVAHLAGAAAAKQCATDPDFSWQGQWPQDGDWKTDHRPAVAQDVQRLGGPLHLPGHLPEVHPDLRRRHVRGADGQRGRAGDDAGVRTASVSPTRGPSQVQIKYATEQLRYPVWGMSPSSTADDTGGYGGFGVEGLTFPSRRRRTRPPEPAAVAVRTCAAETTVTPHASFLALDIAPQAAFANIQKLRRSTPTSTPPTAASTTRSTRPPERSGTGVWSSTSR